jgi:hypothetical protein
VLAGTTDAVLTASKPKADLKLAKADSFSSIKK